MPDQIKTDTLLPPVGRCVYCGATDELTNEHIVPLSFGGQYVLPKASCVRCQVITKRFEQYCARHIYGTFRIKMNFPTRHRKERPKQLPRTALIDGKYKRTLVDPSDAPMMLPLFKFLPPGYVRNPPVREIGWEGAAISHLGIGYKPYEGGIFFRAPGDPPLVSHLDIDPFARMLAKIAHCLCIAELGIDSFEHWLPPYILGDDQHLSYLVGAIPTNIGWIVRPHEYYSTALNRITSLTSGETILGAQIWLFGIGSPSFVIVGNPKTQLPF